MKYSSILFFFITTFSSHHESKKNHFFSNLKMSIYEHKGKVSLIYALGASFGLNETMKYFSLKHKVFIPKKYLTLSLSKKILGLTPFAGASSILSYILISNIPFHHDKTAHFIYPKIEEPLRKLNDIAEELKKLGLEVQAEKFINDASHLNKTPVSAIVTISSEDQIKKVLNYATKKGLKVSMAGARHSMGGQAFVRDGIVLDMNGYNQMRMIDEKTLCVQSGALFSDIQHFLDKQELSVKAMQSVNFCTVGGTLAANAHGIAHDPGWIGATVKKMRVMTADG